MTAIMGFVRGRDLDFFVQLYSIWLVLLPGFNWYMTNLRRLGGFIQVSNICVKSFIYDNNVLFVF